MFLFRNLRFSPNYISWYLFRILTDYNYLLYICLFYNLFHFRLFSLKLTLEWFFFFGFLSFLLLYLFTHFALSIIIDDSLPLFSFPICFCLFTISISCLHFIFSLSFVLFFSSVLRYVQPPPFLYFLRFFFLVPRCIYFYSLFWCLFSFSSLPLCC